jgi:hypothetical protein
MIFARIARTYSSLAASLMWLSACAGATTPPAGSYSSHQPCSNDLQCNRVELPPCARNEHLCYQGNCRISNVARCTQATPSAPTTAREFPVPELSLSLDPPDPPPPAP